MKPAQTHIALTVISDDDRNFFLSLLEPFHDALIEPYTSLSHLKNDCRGKTFNGAVIDIATIVCASTPEKEFFFSMQKGLPVMQIRRNPVTNEISCSVNQPMADHASGAEVLSTFLTSICRNAPARGIRLSARKPISLPIRLSLDAYNFVISASTGNLSKGGCLVISPPWDVALNTPLWLSFEALNSHHPIPAWVRWKKDHWQDDLIGLGMEFERLTPLQQVKLVELLYSA